MIENLIGATTAVFPIRLSVAVTSPVDVEWATRDGSAVAGSDYKATAGTVTFLPGETEKQIEVQVYGQAITPADDKIFFIRLNPPSNAVLVDAILTCTINIIDDQGIPSVAVVVAEGRRGPKGDPGLSAYEQAVLMGYSGTLVEWMDQLADASKAADRAGDHAVSAAEDALKAQNAAKNAVFAGVIFPTAAEGVDPILGVQNGAYFNVRSPLSEHYIDEYQNVNGVAVATGKSYPTSDHFQNISEHTALPFVDSTSYKLNQRVVLANGDIVKSTVDGNVNNPNIEMVGWVAVGKSIILNTVNEMINTNLKNWDVVKTLGYNNLFDDGGAIYLISSAATDYSIPLNNGLHAVFRDEFDIRKFGIVNSPTLRQDENLLRMQRYADFHCYEIDFLGFDIVAPKNIIPISLTAADPRIKQTRGLWFEHPHYIKNLKYHTDKTVTLENGDCGISYYLTDRFPEFETFIGFENCIMDMWSDNYRAFNDPDKPYFGVSDGYRHGISIALSPINHKDQTNYSLIMKNTYFVSPAYSYNIWTDFMLKRQIMESVSGEHLALHIHVAAKEKFISRDCTAIYRSDLLEDGRLIVASAIHLEPEISGRDIKFDDITIDNCKAYYANGSGIIKDEVSRLFLSYQVAGSTQRIGKLSITNSEGICQINNITSIDSIVFSDLPYFNYFIDGVINANSNAAGDTKPYIGSITISDITRCSLKLRYANATIGTSNFNLRNFHINEFRSTDEYISDKIQSSYARHAIADATCIIDNCNLSNVDRITYPLFTGTTVKKLNTSKVKVSHRYSYGETTIKNAELLEFKDTYVGIGSSAVGLDTILNTTVDAGVTPPTVIFDGLSVHHDTLGIVGSGIIFNGVGNYTIKNADLPNLPTFAAGITRKIKNLSGASVEKTAQWTTLSTIAAGGKVTMLNGIDAYMPYVTGVDAYLAGVDVDTAGMDLSVKAYVVGRLVRFHIINEGGAPVTLTGPLTIRYKLVI